MFIVIVSLSATPPDRQAADTRAPLDAARSGRDRDSRGPESRRGHMTDTTDDKRCENAASARLGCEPVDGVPKCTDGAAAHGGAVDIGRVVLRTDFRTRDVDMLDAALVDMNPCMMLAGNGGKKGQQNRHHHEQPKPHRRAKRHGLRQMILNESRRPGQMAILSLRWKLCTCRKAPPLMDINPTESSHPPGRPHWRLHCRQRLPDGFLSVIVFIHYVSRTLTLTAPSMSSATSKAPSWMRAIIPRMDMRAQWGFPRDFAAMLSSASGTGYRRR